MTRLLLTLLALTACSPTVGGGDTAPSTPRDVSVAPAGTNLVTVASPAPSRASRSERRVEGEAHAVPTATNVPTPKALHPTATTNARRAMWDRLVACEAPGRSWRYGKPGIGIDRGYHFEGGPNFAPSTWRAYRLPGYPVHAYDATPAQQITVAERVLAAQGVHAWPQCGPKTGLHR